jgi:ATP-binding cassette, subfamily B, bacterial
MRIPAFLGGARRVPFIPQMEFAECGAAALAMIMAHHGHHVPLAEVREACDVSRDGASARAIVEAAMHYGFEAEGFSLDLDDLPDVPCPALLHWGFQHFVVMEHCGAVTCTIVDPAAGRLHVSRQALDRQFTGIAIVITPGPDLSRRAASPQDVSRYGTIMWSHVPALGRILLASLMLLSISLAVPVATRATLDRLGTASDATWLWGLTVAFGAAAIAHGLILWARGRVVLALRYGMDARFMSRCVEHLMHLPIGFFLQRRVGDLASRVHSNSLMRELLTTTAISSIVDGALLIGCVALMVHYDVILGAVIVVSGVLRMLVHWWIDHRAGPLLHAETVATGREASAVLEIFSAIETIQAAGAGNRMIRRWTSAVTQRLNLTLGHRTLTLLSRHAADWLQGVSLAVVFAVGGSGVLSGRISLGVLGAFLTLEGTFYRPLGTLVASLVQLRLVRTCIARLNDINSTPRDPSGTEAPRLTGALAFEQVSFRYSHAGPDVLSDVTFSIRSGELVAFVGRVGAGKSTLVGLLTGMLQPTRGRILLDGRDVREMDTAAMRRQMGVLLQDGMLFDDTVRANLSLFDATETEEHLVRAVRLACVDDVIDSLPRGYETVLGPNGQRLSGGQRQRLCVARSLVRDPAILVLDEPTAALDAGTEARLMANLATLDCTRVIITHSPGVIGFVPRVLVLEDGRIVERSTSAIAG